MEIGDKVYRYRFDLATGRKSVDVFEVEDVRSKGAWHEIVKCSPTEDGKLCMSGLYFTGREFRQIKTSGTSKYVMLDHDGEDEALTIVLDYVKESMVKLQEKLERTREWADILENWLKERKGE